MAIITLKNLYQEGRLSLGDTLNHSEKGDFELIGVRSDGTLHVRQCGVPDELWTVDFGPGTRVVPVCGSTFQDGGSGVHIDSGDFAPNGGT